MRDLLLHAVLERWGDIMAMVQELSSKQKHDNTWNNTDGRISVGVT